MSTQITPRLKFICCNLGFDLSTQTQTRIRVRCSQCAAVCINGVPCHENQCPNATRECHGCNARIPAVAKFCPDCTF